MNGEDVIKRVRLLGKLREFTKNRKKFRVVLSGIYRVDLSKKPHIVGILEDMIDQGVVTDIVPSIPEERRVSFKTVQRVYEYICSNGTCTTKQIAEGIGLSLHTVRRALRVLLKEDKIKRLGGGNQVRYVAKVKNVPNW